MLSKFFKKVFKIKDSDKVEVIYSEDYRRVPRQLIIRSKDSKLTRFVNVRTGVEHEVKEMVG